MRLYIAAIFNSHFDLHSAMFQRLTDWGKAARRYVGNNILESYHYVKSDNMVRKIRRDGHTIFLDSGAYTAMTKGTVITLDEYCSYVKKHTDFIEVPAVLDAIGSAEETFKNQQEMERRGIRALPCFHYGEPEHYLEHYVANYDYISLGGMVPIETKQLLLWLDRIWKDYLIDKDGKAKIKVHGFGLTTEILMRRYPWYSVDSTSWVQLASRGLIYLPGYGGVSVSKYSPARKVFGDHYDNMAPPLQEAITKRCAHYGFTIEQLRTDYVHRWCLNVLSFVLLAEEITRENPELKFTPKQEFLI